MGVPRDGSAAACFGRLWDPRQGPQLTAVDPH
eukprot:COSAG06_NODE_32654_length_502_cov_1.632754_1_plen_31_part_10